MSLPEDVLKIAQRAKTASANLATFPATVRNQAIETMAVVLSERKQLLNEANNADVEAARSAGLAEPLLKRLKITDKVFAYMQRRLHEVAALPDPLGTILEGQVRPNGLRVYRVPVPLGVIGIIYESRPNVTTDAAAVCLKSGNAVILRGGSESLRTNSVLADAMVEAMRRCNIPEAAVQLIRTTDRQAVGELLRLDQFIDVLIPRGGKSLIERISRDSRIPVIRHYDGVCHLYLAKDADAEMAVSLSVNSKCERVEVCNALETLLVDVGAAERLLPLIAKAFAEQDVELRGCERARQIIPEFVSATEEDWRMEYLAPILAVKVVDNLEAAVEHIRLYGSGHTDGIVTQRLDYAERFTSAVDSASVLVNTSTRLSGGGEYGLGAVVGISTGKLHARGPVGPGHLTSYKWIAYGNGHLRN